MSASVRERLRQTHFLEGFPDSALHQLAKLVTPAEYPTDAVLFEEGSPREFLAIIVAGAVAIEKGQEGRHVRLVTRRAGDRAAARRDGRDTRRTRTDARLHRRADPHGARLARRAGCARRCALRRADPPRSREFSDHGDSSP